MSVCEEIYSFFENKLRVPIELQLDEPIFMREKYFKTRDIIWLFVTLCEKYNLEISELHPFEGEVTIRNIGKYFEKELKGR